MDIRRTINRQIGRNVRAYRVYAELSVAELAIRSQLKPNRLLRIERGIAPSTVNEIERIAAALGHCPSQFFASFPRADVRVRKEQ